MTDINALLEEQELLQTLIEVADDYDHIDNFQLVSGLINSARVRLDVVAKLLEVEGQS